MSILYLLSDYHRKLVIFRCSIIETKVGEIVENTDKNDIKNNNIKIEKRILNLSLAGSIAYLLAEIFAAWLTGSKAVFMDCVYDIADLIMIGPFIILVPLLYKPVTERRPYGFSQVESLFVTIKCSLLAIITIVLIIQSIGTILSGGNHVDASFIAIFEMCMSGGCAIMYFVLKRINRKFSSPSIKAELYIWKLDTYSTLGVGVAFLIAMILDHTGVSFIAPYVDPVIAVVLATLLLKEPISMVIEAQRGMLLFAPDRETVDKIRNIVQNPMDESGYFINFMDVVKTGRKYWIELYFVTGDNVINLDKYKELSVRLNELLSAEFDSIYVELIPDVEKAKAENVEKIRARRQDTIDYIEEKDRRHQEKQEKKERKKKTSE